MYRAPANDAPLLLVVAGNLVKALDRRTGAVAWSLPIADNNRRQNLAPRIWVEHERVIVVASSDMKGTWSADVLGVVTCVDYRSGRIQWQQTFDVNTNAGHFRSTVLVDAGQLLLATSAHVFAFSLEDGALQWVHEGDVNSVNVTASALALPGVAVQADRG